MLWPILLPLKITLAMAIAYVAIATAIAPRWKWKRSKAFIVTTLVACLGFAPSCAVVTWMVDRVRFGEFHYVDASAVQDFRAQRWLPLAATDITMWSYPNGYHAKYRISEADLIAYIDSLWKEYGTQSAAKRDELRNNNDLVAREEIQSWFQGTGWQLPAQATLRYGPVEPDGGGAHYYFDSEAGVAYQHTGYW